MGKFDYKGILTAFPDVKCEIQNAKLCYGEEEDQESWIIDHLQGDWGDIYPMVVITKERFPLPIKLKLRWITLVDLKCYELETELDTPRMEEMWSEQSRLYPDYPFKYIVVGITAYGQVTLWLRSTINQVLFQRYTANQVEYNEMESPVYSGLKGNEEEMKSRLTIEQYESVMKQYSYRYVPLEEYFDGKNWLRYDLNDERYQNIMVNCVEDKRIDGTFDFTDSDNVMKYHATGMPKRITVRWEEDGDPYFAHFWLDPHYVKLFFESFDKMFPGTPVDLKIRLDVKANRFEVAMAANDLTPRAFISTQFIVLKYQEEIARSEYFNKEEDDWRWE